MTTPEPMRNQGGTYYSNQMLSDIGLTADMIKQGIAFTYRILDMLDNTLVEQDAFRLSQMMELANLSTFVGNLLGSGIANASQGVFRRNGPHKYPDLLARNTEAKDVEIKVALESNKPKGHLAKPGYYITCRYVLGTASGRFKVNERGDVVWIWEVRCGYLEEEDFGISNTEGDSGKTAVVTKSGMSKLGVAFIDLNYLPYSPRGPIYKEYVGLYSTNLRLFE